MKILKLRLKNVTQILRGIGLYEFELDFSKTDHVFNILGGTNGSGKTSILNSLSPFADEVILNGMRGEKELVITHKGNIYKIRHYYEPSKTGHTVHSYISKKDKYGNDTVELNPNGNVGDFKQTVERELGVNAYIMKLIKLGNDMGGIIKMTPVERKKYMSAFTADTDIYMTRYKKVNSDCSFLNKTINSYKDKLKMLGDEEALKLTLEQLTNSLNEYNDKINDLSNKKYNNEQIIKEKEVLFNKERYDDLYNKLKSVSNKDNIDMYKEKYSNIIDKPIDVIASKKKEIEITNEGLSTNIRLLNATISGLKEDIDGFLNEQLSQLTIERDKCDCQYTLHEIDEMIKEQEPILKRMEKNLDTTYSIYSLDYILSISTFFDIITNELDAIYPQLEVDELSDDMLDAEKIQKETLDLQSKKTEYNQQRGRIKINIEKFDPSLRSKLSFECVNCPLAKNIEFIDVTSISQFEQMLDELDKKIDEIDKSLEFNYELLKLARIYTRVKDFISNIPTKLLNDLIITENSIKNKIKHTYTVLINKTMLQNIIDKISLNNDYISTKNSLDVLYNERAKASDYNNIENKIREISCEVDNKTEKIKDIQDKVNKYNLEYTINKGMINDLGNIINYKKIKDEYDSYKEEYMKLYDIKNLIKSYNTINNELSEKIQTTKALADSYSQKRDKVIYNLNQISEIRNSIEKYEDLYLEIRMIRDALSIKEGIPLKYVQKFLADTREIANEFIEITFDGNIKLGEFVINDKEFKMPLQGHGQDNEDISTASSGERAIISLALSLALMKQSKTKFKILYLDELDGPLDAEKRRLFLHLLDRQIKEMKIKQVFVITHNNAFSDQPANLILLKDNDIEVNEDIQSVIFRY